MPKKVNFSHAPRGVPLDPICTLERAIKQVGLSAPNQRPHKQKNCRFFLLKILNYKSKKRKKIFFFILFSRKNYEEILEKIYEEILKKIYEEILDKIYEEILEKIYEEILKKLKMDAHDTNSKKG